LSNKCHFFYENCDFGNFSIPPLDEIKFSKSKSRIFIELPLILNLTNFKNLKENISVLKNINGFMKCNTTQNHNLNYPLGINDFKDLLNQEFQRTAFLNTPQFYFMGENDENDAIPYDDAFDQDERELIYEFLGEEMLFIKIKG